MELVASYLFKIECYFIDHSHHMIFIVKFYVLSILYGEITDNSFWLFIFLSTDFIIAKKFV